MGPDSGFRYSKVKTFRNQLSQEGRYLDMEERLEGFRKIAGFEIFQTNNRLTPHTVRLFISKY